MRSHDISFFGTDGSNSEPVEDTDTSSYVAEFVSNVYLYCFLFVPPKKA